MKKHFILIFTFFIAGFCESQQKKIVSKDSLGKLLQGTWSFDSLPGQRMVIEYRKAMDGSLWKDKRDIVATITDTVKNEKSLFQIIPNVTDVKLSFSGYQKVQAGYPPNPADTGAGVCILMTDNALKGVFGVKFPYEIKSISSTSLVLVKLRAFKKNIPYKLTKSKN